MPTSHLRLLGAVIINISLASFFDTCELVFKRSKISPLAKSDQSDLTVGDNNLLLSHVSSPLSLSPVSSLLFPSSPEVSLLSGDECDTNSDLMLARLLQTQYDRECDTQLLREERKYNGESKGGDPHDPPTTRCL